MQYRFQSGDHVYNVTIERHGEGFQAYVDGQPFDLEVLDSQPGQVSLRFQDHPAVLYWAVEGSRKWISINGCTYLLDKPAPRRSAQAAEPDGGSLVRSPMPAQVRLVQTAVGDPVEPGQTLLLLEAMKMEIRIKAPGAGKVRRLLVSNGQAVDKDQVLVEIGVE